MSERMPGSPALADRLASLCACRKTAEPEMMAEVVRAVLETVGGHLSEQDARLLAEVEELGRTIAEAKAEIAALRVDDVTASQIPSATDELDAVVAHTAAATNAILEACETLDEAAGRMDGPQAVALQTATMRIYEACSFQDITGQRITKVVSTLKAIDAKVAHIISKFGDNRHVRGAPAPEQAAPSAEAGLLNGPQLPAAAMDQAEIDRMLADF
jgi:chemotaxis protein CheZ